MSAGIPGKPKRSCPDMICYLLSDIIINPHASTPDEIEIHRD